MKTRMIMLMGMLSVLVGFWGCGTITTGSKQNIGLNSTPAGAKVTSTKTGMLASMNYTTPATITFERKGGYILTFEKDGYDTKQVELLRSMRGWMLVWDIFWFPVGVVVDAITGAWYRLEPYQIDVTLTKLTSSVDGPDQIRVWFAKTLNKDHLQVMSSIPVNLRINATK